MILLMFSGGLDSTGVFYKLIKEKCNLHVHHMNLINIENRSEAESIAVKNICDYMKKIGDFSYSESSHEVPFIKGQFMWDSDLYNFMAGSICLINKEIKKVALGLTKSDLKNHSVDKRIERGNKILKCFNENVEKIYPVVDMDKKEIYNYLPEDLRNLTWSCRKPIYSSTIRKCGNCKSCIELRSIFSRQK